MSRTFCLFVVSIIDLNFICLCSYNGDMAFASMNRILLGVLSFATDCLEMAFAI